MMLHALIVASPLTPLENLLRDVLRWLGPHGTIGLTWAWSIVALTVIVRLLLVPLTVRQIHSMQNLQRHAPQMKEIQKKYKADKKRQQEELMKFYKENNINPASSCLPLLAQFPVFISLYLVLKHFPHLPGDNLEWLRLWGITTTAPARRQPGVAGSLEHHRQGLGRLGPRARRRLRAQPARLELLHERDRREVAADHAARPADRLHPVHHQLQGRARPLLDDDQPVDGRPGADHAPADAEAGRAGEALLPYAAEGGRDRGGGTRAGGRSRAAVPAAQGEAQEGRRAAMTTLRVWLGRAISLRQSHGTAQSEASL